MHRSDEQCFERRWDYCCQLGDDSDWVPIEDLGQCLEKGKFFRRRDAKDPGAEIVRRSEITVPAPLAALVALLRPEVFYHPRRPEFVEGGFYSCGIDKLVAPGDAYCWSRMSEATALQLQLDALLAIASKRTGDVSGHHQVSSEGIFMSMRMALRRDFPQPGQHTALMAFRHPDTGHLLEGAEHAMYFLMRAHDDPSKTRLLTVKRQAPLSSSVASLVVPKLSTLLGKSAAEKKAVFLATLSNPEFRSVCQPDFTYLVLSLRKCTRGVPLLPLHRDACEETLEDWEQLKAAVVPLPEYLRELLRRLEIPDVDVFDSLDGRAVVPYQAVVQQRAWERAWASLEAPWGRMRTAYRRKLGGAQAPKLETGTEPKYQTVSRDSLAEAVESDEEETCGASGVPVRGTFVHYSRKDAEPQRRRCDTGDAAVMGG